MNQGVVAVGVGVGDCVGVGVGVGVGATTIGNLETFRTTVVPLSVTVSAIGVCAITVFSATAPLSSKTTSTRKPALSNVFFASV